MSWCRRERRGECVRLTMILIFASVIAAQQSTNDQPHPERPVAAAQVTGTKLYPIKTTGLWKYSCPASFTLHGEIVTNGATKVEYTWISSDGRSWPQRTLTFASAGLQSVTEKGSFGEPGKKLSDSIQLSVLSPNKVLSNKILLGFTCAK